MIIKNATIAATRTPPAEIASTWAFDPKNAAAVAGWGFWLAVAGLILTIGGFVITIVQLKRTRSAAAQEAGRIKQALRNYEVTNEVTRATTSLQTARNYIRHGLWANVAESYEIVGDSLEALKDDAASLSASQIERLEAASKYIQILCGRIERDIVNGKLTINSAKTLSVATEHRLLLLEISRVVEKETIQ